MAAGSVVMVPGPCRPGPFTTGVKPPSSMVNPRARGSGGVGAVERGVRPVRDRPPRPGRGDPGLSKSATKTRIEPEHARRNVDIPHLSSPPIPTRSAFVADLDTTPPQVATGAPPAPLKHAQNNLPLISANA